MSLEAFKACLQAQDLEGAREAYTRLDGKTEAADILCDITEDLDVADSQQLQLALGLCDAVLRDSPPRSEVHLWRLKLLAQFGKHDEALRFAFEHRSRVEVLWELFELCCIHGQHERADSLLSDLREHGTEQVGNFYFNLGYKFHLKSPRVALSLYKGSIACGSPVPQAYINAGLAAIGAGEIDTLLTLAREGIEHYPTDPNLWANLIDGLTRSDEEAGLRSAVNKGRGVLGRSSRCDGCDCSSQVTACTTGCGALLDDMMNALLSLGDPSGALELYEAHDGGDAEPTTRARLTRVRALAALGKHEEAHAILDGGMSIEDAGSAGFFRARAAASWAAGDTDRTVGALAAFLGDNYTNLTEIENDASLEAVKEHPDFAAKRRIRPPNIPSDAWFGDAWNDSDEEWVVAENTADERPQGLVKYYRPDGTLCCACEHVDGKPHGTCTRYHQNGEVSQSCTYEAGVLHGTRTWFPTKSTTTERTLTSGMSHAIVRIENDYVHGEVTSVRTYLEGEKLCTHDGVVYPDRPSDVPMEAMFFSKDGCWRHLRFDANGKPTGKSRVWNGDGQLLEESDYADGDQHGPYRAFFPDGTVSVSGQYAEGEQVGTWVYRRNNGDAHEDFPTAGEKVERVELSFGENGDSVRYYNADGTQTTIDGMPIDQLPVVHAALGNWFAEIEAVDWSALEDAGGSATSIPSILVGLLAQDDEGSEAVSDSVWGSLWWHLCHQGTVYSATGAALPFIIRLAAYEGAPHRTALLEFISSCACEPPDTIERARAEEWDDLLGCYEALVSGVDLLLPLLESQDDELRAAASRTVSGAHGKKDEVTAALLALYERDDTPHGRGNVLFSLGRLATDAGLGLLERELDNTELPGACAAMALVMARGPDCGERVLDRLVDEVERADDERSQAFGRMPWADSELVTELGEALAFGGGGAPVLDRLIERFGSVDPHSALRLVGSAIQISIHLGDGELTPELRKVLTALVETDKPWTFDVNMREILEEFDLPAGRDQLRDLLEE